MTDTQISGISFTINYPPTTKKNSQRLIKVGKRTIPIPSKAYQSFEDCVCRTIKVSRVISYPCNVKCVFYAQTRRKIDLPNLLNAVDDALVKANVFADDNRDIIAMHDGSIVLYDKLNPRIEVEITQLYGYEQWR